MRIKKSERELVKAKYGGCCAYCGIKLNGRWEVDHLKPIRRDQDGGCEYPERHTFDNFMPSCVSCNRDKNTYQLETWRSMLYNKVNVLNRDFTPYKIAKRYGLVVETDKEIVFYFEGYIKDE